MIIIGRRWAKAVLEMDGQIKTVNVRTPAILKSPQNRDVGLMRVGMFGKRVVAVDMSDVWTSPAGEYAYPDLIIAIAGRVAAGKTAELKRTIDEFEAEKRRNIMFKNENESLFRLLQDVRLKANKEVADMVKAQLDNIADFKNKASGQGGG